MSDLVFRRAQRDDLPALVHLLVDDILGAGRECSSDPLPDEYAQAFAAIDADPNQLLVVTELNERLVGMLQLTYTPHLTHRGSWRATIESVRIARGERGQGLGRAMMEYALDCARERGCRIVQLTTDRRRTDAIRFYDGLGFASTHEGMKLHIERV